MKVAIDIRDAGKEKTGKGWYTFNIVRELLELDKKNQYILYGNTKKSPFEKESDKVKYKFIDTKPLKWHFSVLKDLKDENVDLFFAPTSYIIPALAPAKLKVIITVHDLVAFFFPGSHKTKAVLIERLTLKKALKKVHAVLVVSENTKKDLLKKFIFPEQRIHITYCAPSNVFNKPVTGEELEEFRIKSKLPQNFILAVGTMEPRKNLSTLIKSFVVVKKRFPDFKLVLVGKKGWKYHRIEKTLEEFKMKDDVIFPGYLKDRDLQKIYKLATVFVFPSLYEGFGIPPLEAMASGCPVVSSNAASLPEVVGEAGLLIDPTNSYKLAESISSLIENEHVRNMMIERGHKQAEKFNWKDSAKVIYELINSQI